MVNFSLGGLGGGIKVIIIIIKKKLTFYFGKIFNGNGYLIFTLVSGFHQVSVPDECAFTLMIN